MSEEEDHDDIAPLDILIEIFKRLPIKSLIQFTSVSKTWRSIIRSSRFIADYNIQPCQFFVSCGSNNYVNIYNDNDISFLQRLTLPMSPEHPLGFKSNYLIGYSQGLFGFDCYNNNNEEHVFIIWNPSIRKSLFIPLPKSKFAHPFVSFHFTVCNATDPTIIKTLFYISSPQGMLVETFKLSTGVWRTLDIVPPRQSLVLSLLKEVVVGSFIHWIAHDTKPEGVRLNNLILSFDIASEQFTELSLPPTLAQTHIGNLDFSKFRESLIVLDGSDGTEEIGVWMMEPGVQNSFKKLFTVKLPWMIRESPRVLGFRKNGQPIVYLKDAFYNEDALLSYEPNLEHFKDVEISEPKYSWHAGSLMETLHLLDH